MSAGRKTPTKKSGRAKEVPKSASQTPGLHHYWVPHIVPLPERPPISMERILAIEKAAVPMKSLDACLPRQVSLERLQPLIRDYLEAHIDPTRVGMMDYLRDTALTISAEKARQTEDEIRQIVNDFLQMAFERLDDYARAYFPSKDDEVRAFKLELEAFAGRERFHWLHDFRSWVDEQKPHWASIQPEELTQRDNETTLAEAAKAHDVPKSAWTKAAKLPTDDANHLPTRQVGRNRFVKKTNAAKFAENYRARQDEKRRINLD